MSEVTEVKTAVETTTASDVKAVESRVTALETEVKTWYEKHLPLLAGIVGLVIGLLIGHFVKL